MQSESTFVRHSSVVIHEANDADVSEFDSLLRIRPAEISLNQSPIGRALKGDPAN